MPVCCLNIEEFYALVSDEENGLFPLHFLRATIHLTKIFLPLKMNQTRRFKVLFTTTLVSEKVHIRQKRGGKIGLKHSWLIDSHPTIY